MAGLFRKRQFKPWITAAVISKDKKLKSKVVKVLCRRSKSAQECVVMLVSDGELSISAIFSAEAVDNALSNLGLEQDSSWDTALLILHEFTLELKVNVGQETGEFVLFVEKFNIWDLQPGYQAKFDVKYCMEHVIVREAMMDEIRNMKEKAACQSQSNKTGSIALTQLLDEMANPSESFSQSSCDEWEEVTAELKGNKSYPLTESLMEKLIQPFTVEEFLIPPSQDTILQNIPEWKPDYQLTASVQLEEDSLPVSDQQFDVCAANTLASHPENIKESRNSRESSQDVIYLGISVTPPEHPDSEEVKPIRQSPCPVSILFKQSNMDSQSQGTSSQWQEEVDSVRFSFEELHTTVTPESQEESQRPEQLETSDRICKHNETAEKSSISVSKETDGEKDFGSIDESNFEKHSCKFVTEEILKKKSCAAVSEIGSKRASKPPIKESEVVKTVIPLKMRVETLGTSLNQANSEKGGGKVVNNENRDEINDIHLTKENCEEGNHSVVTKRVSEEEPHKLITMEMNGEKMDALVTKEHGEERDGTIVTKRLLVEEADKGVSKEQDVLVSKEYSEESLSLGPPNAQSTQINEVENSNTKCSHRNTLENIEVLLDNTEENENNLQEENRTNYSEIVSLIHSSVSDNVLGSQDDRDVKVSHRNATCVPASNVDSSVFGKDEVVGSEYEAIIDTSQEHVSNSSISDVDKPIMINYYSQNSSSPSHNWNNVLLRLAEKKKRLEALKYIANRISTTLDDNDKREDTETDKIENYNSSVLEEIIRDVNHLCSDDSKNDEGEDKIIENSLVMVGEDCNKTDNENMTSPSENVTEEETGGDKLIDEGNQKDEYKNANFSDSLGFEDEHILCGVNKSRLDETSPGDQSEMDTVDTTDTGYPLASLTLQESFEENDSCLLPSDNVLEQTDLEAVDRIHCENIAKHSKAHIRVESDQDSVPSDIEIIGYSHQKCTSFMKEISQEISSIQEGVLKPCDKIKDETVNYNPLVPLYFETESGSKRRSKRLYDKVISCRQKDSLMNSSNKENSSTVSSRINDITKSSRKEIIEREKMSVDSDFVVIRQLLRKPDENADCVTYLNAGSNVDENIERVITSELQGVAEGKGKSSNTSIDKDVGVKKKSDMKSQSIANFTSLKTGQGKDPFNSDSNKQETSIWKKIDENILKTASKTNYTKWKFKKDVRIMLERCDQIGNNYMKGNKRRQSSFGSCYKSSESGNPMEKTDDGSTLQKPLESRNTLLKSKDKSGKVLREESPETECSMTVNFPCACCRLEENIETRKVQHECDKAVNLLRIYDKSSVFSSLKLSMKKIQGVYKIVSKKDSKRNGDVSENIDDPQYSDTEDRVIGTKRDKDKLKRKADVLEIVLDPSKENEVIANSTSDSSTESEIIPYSTAAVEIENKTKKERNQVLQICNRIEITELPDGANSDIDEVCFISEKSEVTKTDEEPVREKVDACSFENQFKDWITKYKINSEKEIDKSKDCQDSRVFARHSVESDKKCMETENKKSASDKESNTEMENCKENIPEHSFQPTASPVGGDVLVAEESSQKDTGLQPCDQVSLTSPVLCTQPFEICPYQQTQEFVPKLSETMVQTSLLESQTACNNESLCKSNIFKDSDMRQTQEFRPKLSESFVQTSMLESSTFLNESINDRSIFKDSDKTKRSPIQKGFNSLKEGHIETTNECEKHLTKSNLGERKEGQTSMKKSSPEKVKEPGAKQVTIPFHLGQIHKKVSGYKKENVTQSDSSVTKDTSLNNHFEHTRNNEIEAKVNDPPTATAETACKSSAGDKTFTKLMKKCESSDFWAISKPEKLAFKVKPVKRTSIQRKRKSDYYSLDNTNKKQKCTDSNDEYNEVLKEKNDRKTCQKQNNKVAEMVKIHDNLNDSLEDFDLNKSPSKKAKTSTKTIQEESVVVRDRENVTKSKDGVKIPCKTYEPRKMIIDGHCFGNKVFWQNFIESPYSAPGSSETKNKSYVEKTNKRKSRLNSSQESQKKSSSSAVGENVNKIEHEALNRSSESLFSGENEENELHHSSPDSVSLLPRKKADTSVLGSDTVKTHVDQTRLKECVKIVNESGTKNKRHSGELICTKVNGTRRFYRQKDTKHERNKDSDLQALTDPLLSRYQRRNTKLDKYTYKNSKQVNSVNQQKKEHVEKAERNKMTSLEKRGPALNEMYSVDKKLFVEDWLMKHKTIGEQGCSSLELSPPEIQTSGNSLPSYQPNASAGGQGAKNNVPDRDQSFILHEVSTEEQQKRDNSLHDASSSESSDSIRSEDLNKPMSAAARYLLKFRKARRERKRKKTLNLKSGMKQNLSNDWS